MYWEIREISEKNPENLLGKKSELRTAEKNIGHYFFMQEDWIIFLIGSQKALLEANTVKELLHNYD